MHKYLYDRLLYSSDFWLLHLLLKRVLFQPVVPAGDGRVRSAIPLAAPAARLQATMTAPDNAAPEVRKLGSYLGTEGITDVNCLNEAIFNWEQRLPGKWEFNQPTRRVFTWSRAK